MRKMMSLLLSLSILFTVFPAFAGTVCPIVTQIGQLAGKTVNATVGAYDEETKTFTVTVYDYDRYDKEDVANLAVGDTILAGGWLYKINGTENVYWTCDDGEEICFGQYGDDVQARSSFNDRVFMSVVTVLHIPAAGGIVYEDFSDPDARKWYADKIRGLMDMGAAVIKTDFGEGIPD